MLRLATAAVGLLVAAAPLAAQSPTLILTGARTWTGPAGRWYPEGPIDREMGLRTRTIENVWAAGRKHVAVVPTVVGGRIVHER